MKYDAFISYRHTELDMYVAKKIHKYLETFKVPKAVAKKGGKKRINRVFRDQEELPIGSDLGNNIEYALSESEFLIVICSPRTIASEWVLKEINTFISMHDREHVLAVLVEGEPNESFPAPLLSDEQGNPVEPLAADVRAASRKEVDKLIKSEGMRLCAPLLYCSYDDLRQRHRERRMKKIIRTSVAAGLTVACLGIGFGIYNAYNASIIQKNYTEKLKSQSKCLATQALELSGEGKQRAAALIAMEALMGDDPDTQPFVPTAEYALSEALGTYELGNDYRVSQVINNEYDIKNADISSDGKVAVIQDSEGIVSMWDTATAKKLCSLESREGEYSTASISSIAMYDDETAIIVDTMGYRLLKTDGTISYDMSSGEYLSLSYLSEDKSLIAFYKDEAVDIVEVATGETITSYERKTEALEGGKTAFSSDNKYVATGAGKNIIICSLEDGKVKKAKAAYPYATEFAFSSDDSELTVISFDMDGGTSESGVPTAIEGFKTKDGKKLWDYKGKGFNYLNGTTDLDGSDTIAANIGQTFVYMDALTGEVINETTLKDDPVKITYSDGIAIAFYYDGSSQFIGVGDQLTYYDDIVDFSTDISDVEWANYVLIAYSNGSTDLTVVSKSKGQNVEEITSYDEDVNGIASVGDSDKYYCTYIYDSNSQSNVYVYNSDGEELKHFTHEAMLDDIVSADEENIAVVYDDGTIDFYNCASDQEQEVTSTVFTQTVKCKYSSDVKKLLLYEETAVSFNYAYVDLVDKKIIKENSLSDSNCQDVIFQADNSKVYLRSYEGELNSVDLASGELEAVKLSFTPGSFMPSSDGESMCLSQDGSLFAIICDDNTIRMVDTETLEVKYEVEDYFNSVGYVAISPDNSLLVYQGDSYNIKFYRLEENELIYNISTTTDRLTNFQWFDDEIAVFYGSNMTLLDAEQILPIAEFSYIAVVSPENDFIYAVEGKSVYKIKYESKVSLIAQAKDLYGDNPLTLQERLEYNLD